MLAAASEAALMRAASSVPWAKVPERQPDGDHVHQRQASFCQPLVARHDGFVMSPKDGGREENNQPQHD
jgi:hypothetical protein